MRRKWITPAMIRLVDATNIDCIFKVDLVPTTYYMTQEQLKNGCAYYCGSVPLEGGAVNPLCEEKLPFNEEQQILVCNLNLPITFVNDMEKLKNIASKIQVTEGGQGNKLEPLSVEYRTECKIENTTMYYVKLPGFDEFFKAFKIQVPDATEKDILGCKVVGSPVKFFAETPTPLDTDRVIDTFTKKYKTVPEICGYKFTLQIIATDIEPNFDLLVEILQLVAKYAEK